MLYTELTQRAMKTCFEAHKDQDDKGGVPYVFHPFHVAEQMETEEEICVALLHDVIEDSSIRLEDLAAEGFPQEVLDALDLLTHKEGEDYLDYVQALSGCRLAARVKLADLRHNSTQGRLRDPGSYENRERLKKYLKAQAILTGGEKDEETMTLTRTLTIHREGGPGPERAVNVEVVSATDGRFLSGRIRSDHEEPGRGEEKLFTDFSSLADELASRGFGQEEIDHFRRRI